MNDSFLKHLFCYDLIRECDDQYKCHTLLLSTCFHHEINLQTWDNKKFLTFIKNVKRQKDAFFNYIIKNNCDISLEYGCGNWAYEGSTNQLSFNTFYFGSLYERPTIKMTDHYILMFEKIAKDINEYESDCCA